MKAISSLSSYGCELDLSPESFGELRRSGDLLGDPAALRERFAEDGYLYLPGFFQREKIQAVRAEFIRRLESFGALDPAYPAAEAVPVNNPSVPAHGGNGLTDGNKPLEEVIFGGETMAFYQLLLGGKCLHYDYVWSRAIPPGKGTAPHCDLVYMGRGTHDVMTAWIPYGDVSLELGGLMMLEKSHLQQERLRHYLNSDVDTYCANLGPYKHKSGYLSSNPVSLREKLGGRWLTTSFRMGDLLTFGMKTVHASVDNRTHSYRLSTDTRYQLASEPADHRWIGPDTEAYAAKNRIGKIC